MARSANFTSPVHQRILDEAKTQPSPGSVRGPVPFLNPTRARFPLVPIPEASEAAAKAPQATESPLSQDAQVEWRARDYRKGNTATCL